MQAALILAHALLSMLYEFGKGADGVQGDDMINVAPKKANWDLRRDVGRKLEKLERRTQRALVAIMQEQKRQTLAGEGAQAD